MADLTDKSQRKRQGFDGQRLVVLPKKITTDFLAKDPVTRQAYITDIGYYPKARFHYVERLNGISQHILIYCAEGSGWVEIGKNRYEVSPSSLICIPSGTAHKYASNEKDPWTIYWIHFKGEAAATLMEQFTQRSRDYQLDIPFNAERIRFFETMCTTLEKGYSGDNLRYVNMVFYHFLSSFLYEEKFTDRENKTGTDVVALSIELMQQKLHETLTLTEIAGFARLSVSHFSAIFREKTGYSPMEYFNHLKVQKACQYLLLTNMRIKEIADELGISDPYYFSRLFTKIMGASPNDYRKKSH